MLAFLLLRDAIRPSPFPQKRRHPHLQKDRPPELDSGSTNHQPDAESTLRLFRMTRYRHYLVTENPNSVSCS